jgi:hypothetical protein
MMPLQFNWADWDWATWQQQNCQGDYQGVDESVSQFIGAIYDHVRSVANGGAGGGLSQAEVEALITAHAQAANPHTGYVLTGDSRLSDARTPLAHNQAASTITSGTFDIARIPTGSSSTTVCLGNDARLSDARTPTTHVHAGSDITTGTVAAARLPTFGAAAAGIVPQSGGGTANFLRADGTWAAPSGGGSSLPSPVSLGGYVVLTNISASYDGTNPQRGLGFVEVSMTGVSSIVFTVQVNKIGTGTQSWQLWNETDGAQVGVIADSGAAGNKTLSQTFSGLALTGVKRLRVRALSSVNTDDPVYYGASLRFA